ncbi:MAG: metal ABC transporter ATP-binding protein [Clostridia bacterium]|nr:metal ABC transporter ATP-binding protein [Clostridia bacterium]
MTIIKCSDVTMSYEGVNVFEHLSFTLERGDYLCILGENGSGKSTLMKGILGLIKPSGGLIEYSDGLQQKEIGYLPQQSPVQRDFPASVYEVVLSGTLNRRRFSAFYGKREHKLADKNMERLSITDLKNSCYRDLSGGQQQRVLLARALCATKSLLLLDEPVTGLDPVASAEFYDLISDLNKNDKITVIMVSHDVKQSIKKATHILYLENKTCFFGSVDDYLNSSVSDQFVKK